MKHWTGGSLGVDFVSEKALGHRYQSPQIDATGCQAGCQRDQKANLTRDIQKLQNMAVPPR
jgi:hypothetical protein